MLSNYFDQAPPLCHYAVFLPLEKALTDFTWPSLLKWIAQDIRTVHGSKSVPFHVFIPEALLKPQEQNTTQRAVLKNEVFGFHRVLFL